MAGYHNFLTLSLLWGTWTFPAQGFKIQRSLYFNTTHGTKKMWSYIAGGLKIKVILTQKIALWDQIMQSYNQGWS